MGRKRQFLGIDCLRLDIVTLWKINLGNILMRLTLGLPGRLEAGQRSKAGLAHANLENDDDDYENDKVGEEEVKDDDYHDENTS